MDFLKSVTNTVSSVLPGNKKNNVVTAVAENSNGDVAVLATNAPAVGGRRRSNRKNTRRNTRRNNMRRTTRRNNMRRNTRRNNMRRNTRRNRRNNY